MTYPADPNGDMTPILEASIEAAKLRHPSGKALAMVDTPTDPAYTSTTAVLTAHDRCDNCGAAAAYRLGKISPGPELQLCAHHWRKHFPAMQSKGWAIVGQHPDVFKGVV